MTKNKWLDKNNGYQHGWVRDKLKEKGLHIEIDYENPTSEFDHICTVIKKQQETAEGREGVRAISTAWYAKLQRVKKKKGNKVTTNYYLKPSTVSILKKYKRDNLLRTIDEAVDHLVENENEKRKISIKEFKEANKTTKEKNNKIIDDLKKQNADLKKTANETQKENTKLQKIAEEAEKELNNYLAE